MWKGVFFMTICELEKEFLFDCEVRELSKKTIHNYEKQLKQFEAFLRGACAVEHLDELKPIHIKQFVAMLQKRGCKPSYTNDMLKAVKVLCGYAYREGYTEELITKRVRNVKEPKVLIHTFNKDEINSLVHYYKNDDYLSIRNKLIIMMLFDTGIRIEELMTMRPEQIQDNYFVIYGKGNKERVVPKSATVSKWMGKYMTVRNHYFDYRDAQPYVFLSKNGKMLTEEAVRKFLISASKDVGVNPIVRVSPHTFRHTFAHQQLKNGLDLYSLSRLLGHESVSITQRYLEGIEDTEILSSARRTGVLLNL